MSGPAQPTTRKRALINLCVAGFFARLSYSMARTPVLALFAYHLGAPPEGIGLVVGISTVTGIFFKLPSGVLSDIVGRRSLLITGLCVFAFVPFSYLLVTGYWQLVFVRFVHGFATAIFGPVAMAAVADAAGRRKAEQLSWFSSVTIIGTLCGAPLGGFLLWWWTRSEPATLATYHLIYVVIGVLGSTALAVALSGLGGLKPGDALRPEQRALSAVYRRFVTGVRQLIGDRAIVLTSGVEGLQNMTLGALEAFLPVYAVAVAGLNPLQAGLLWAFQIIVTVVAKPMMGRMADRRGGKRIILIGALLCAGAFLAIPLATSFAWLAGFAMIFGLGEAFVTSSAAAMVADMCEEANYGAAMGTFGTIYDIGHATGPIAAGLLLAGFSGNYFLAFLPLAALLVSGSAVFFLTVEERSPIHATHRR